MMRCLRNVVQVLTHKHPYACWTVWSSHGATYCWICERAITDAVVPGYVVVDRETGQILRGRRGDVPTPAFFIGLHEAVFCIPDSQKYVVQPARATLNGIQVLP